MNEERFWSIVDASKEGGDSPCRSENVAEQNQRIEDSLADMSPEELVSFQRCLEECMHQACRPDMMAAAAIINDDREGFGFHDFLGWLISQGREAFGAALADPESLAEHPTVLGNDDAEYPAFREFARHVYKDRTGQDMPATGIVLPEMEAGIETAADVDAIASQFPRLWQVRPRDYWREEMDLIDDDRLPPPLTTDIPPMAEDRFWELIEESRSRARKKKLRRSEDFLERHIEQHTEVLQRLTPEELIAYDRRFGSYVQLAYRWDLWGAAYWLHGGCSDDGFLDFRSCLISLGKDWFFQVLENPDTLADLVDRRDVPYLQGEGFQYVATNVYREKSGNVLMPQPPGESGAAPEPEGVEFDFEDEELMRQRYPKVVAKFPEMGD